MSWFRRTRRVAMDPYEPPEEREPASVESIVAEGVLVADSVVRMTLRNHIIVSVLRDRLDLDRDALVSLAAREFELLAEHEREGAERQQARSERMRFDEPLPEDSLPGEPSWREGSRRLTIRHAMAQSYADRGAESPALLHTVERARTEAWDQIAEVLLGRMTVADVVVDARYLVERNERIAALLALDLSALAAERGVVLE